MAKKEKKEEEKRKENIRKIEQAFDKYLKYPSPENAQELRSMDYLPIHEKRLAKLGNKILKPIMELVIPDDSEGATEALKQISQASSRPIWARLKAMDALKTRKADYDESLRKGLMDIEKVAKKDGAEQAEKFFSTLIPSLQEAFAEAVIEHKAVNALEGASHAASDKAAIKILRRAAHILASMGQKVAPIGEKGESIYKPPEKQEPQAFVSHIDSEGKRVVLMIVPGFMGQMNLFQGLVDERVGLEDFQAVETGRSGARNLLKSVKEAKLIQVDEVYASHLLDKAAALASSKNQSIPPVYLSHRAALPAIPAEYKPLDPREKLPSAPSRDDARKASSLLERDDFVPWFPDEDIFRSVQLRLDEIATSRVIINDAQRKSQLDKAISDGAIKYLAGEGAERLAARLESSAYLFVAQDKLDAARLAIAAADEIREYASSDQSQETKEPPDFVMAIFKRAFPNIGKVEPEEKPDEPKRGSRLIIP